MVMNFLWNLLRWLTTLAGILFISAFIGATIWLTWPAIEGSLRAIDTDFLLPTYQNLAYLFITGISYILAGIFLVFICACTILWLYRVFEWLKTLGTESRQNRLSQVNAQLQLLSEQTQQFRSTTEAINQSMAELEQRTSYIYSSFQAMRHKLRAAFNQLERDLSGIIEFIKKQLSDNLADLLALFQVFLGLYLPEIFDAPTHSKNLTPLLAVGIFFILCIIKNPYHGKLRKLISIITLEIAIISLTTWQLIDNYLNGIYLKDKAETLIFLGFSVTVLWFMLLKIIKTDDKDPTFDRLRALMR